MYLSARITIRNNDWTPQSLRTIEGRFTLQELVELLEKEMCANTVCVDISLWNEQKLQLMRGETIQGTLVL